MKVLVTGATGYIGGRLVPKLLGAGHAVRVLVRDAHPVKGRPWEPDVEVLRGDLFEMQTLVPALRGVDAAFYLVHSMYGGRDFEERDRQAAQNFVDACKQDVGETKRPLPHVIYLGGLQPRDQQTRSKHLRSRAEVGRVLAQGLPGRVTEFRAGPIIGSGSASFEMVRYLTERLPVMVTPRWVSTKVQTIAVRDVLAYMEAAMEDPAGPAGVVEIGTDVLTFKGMMQEVARCRGLRRWIIPTPVLAPKLAARWVGAVTPIPNALAVPLVEGVTQDLIADTGKAERLYPQIKPIGFGEAVKLALTKIERGEVDTRWSGTAVQVSSAGGGQDIDTLIEDREGLARDQRTIVTDVPAGPVFAQVKAIGGEHGWYAYGWAWWLRGVVDALMGGPGLRRGRRHPEELLEGEALDWWRVDAIREVPPDPDTAGQGALLRLRAEMRLPGRAWLQWEVDRRDGQTVLRQTALFEPSGLPGTAYWYSLLPAHGLIFPSMLKQIEAHARERWERASAAVDEPEPAQTDGPPKQEVKV